MKFQDENKEDRQANVFLRVTFQTRFLDFFPISEQLNSFTLNPCHILWVSQFKMCFGAQLLQASWACFIWYKTQQLSLIYIIQLAHNYKDELWWS